MDSFTERILERARERQRKLLGTAADNINVSQKSKSSPDISEMEATQELATRKVVASDSNINAVALLENNAVKETVSADMPGSPQLQPKVLNIQRDTFNMEIKVNSADNIRLQVEIEERSDDEDDKENHTDTIQQFSIKGDNDKEIKLAVSPLKPPAEKEASKALEWDQRVLKNLESQGFTKTTSNARLVYKFQEENKTPSKINDAEHSSNNSIEQTPKLPLSVVESSPAKLTPKSPVKTAAFASRASVFEASPSRQNKDPALLTVSERKALFEKNKGAAPLPKAPISLATPIKSDHTPKVAKPVPNVDKVDATPKSPPKPHHPNEISVSPKKCDHNGENVAKKAAGIASTVAALFQNKTTIGQQQIQNNVKAQRQKEMELLLNRFQRNKEVNDDEHSEEENGEENEEDEEDVSETAAMIPQKPAQIVKRPELAPPPPPPPPTNPAHKRRSGGRRYSEEDSAVVAAVLDEVKRIKVVPPKDGKLYPCLSDIETATETETDQQSPTATPDSSYQEDETDTEVNTSFGRDILETVCKHITPQKRSVLDESSESDFSDAMNDVYDYLDEGEDTEGPTPPKQGRSKSPNAVESSCSFHYKNYAPQNRLSPGNFKTPVKNPSPHKDDTSTYVVEGDNMLPLTHTVSFYRKQQGQTPKTSTKQIIRQPIIEEAPESPICVQNVNTKMQQLLDEIMKQQTVISQTSQAINLCYSTPEFVGSTELVEAEQFLLLATSRRSAAQQELESLQVTKSVSQPVADNGFDKGTLTISNICFPLKREYARALAAAGGKGHHVLCLVKHKEKVLCTPLVSTVGGSIKNPTYELKVPGSIKLENVYSSFAIHVEVYCLQAQEEILPHDVKYHINKKPNSKATPKKSKQENPLVKPPRESPAGPNAVRSPAFALMGYIIFNVQAINRKQFTLNNTPSMSPLTGIIEMSIKYDVEICVDHRGFLTMFEDVSGFGAWHRRWCYLNGCCLSYWKYPDDEKKKAPIDTIDLRTCVTNQVGPVSKDICARLHTMLIETQRSSMSGDKDSLVMICRGENTIIRHLLSADTKDERNDWCIKLNKALTAIKMSNKTANDFM